MSSFVRQLPPVVSRAVLSPFENYFRPQLLTSGKTSRMAWNLFPMARPINPIQCKPVDEAVYQVVLYRPPSQFGMRNIELLASPSARVTEGASENVCSTVASPNSKSPSFPPLPSAIKEMVIPRSSQDVVAGDKLDGASSALVKETEAPTLPTPSVSQMEMFPVEPVKEVEEVDMTVLLKPSCPENYDFSI